MPQIAALFGIAVDPKARPPRPLQVPRGDKGPHKRAGDLNKTADGKPSADKPRRGPKPQGSESQKTPPTASAPAPVASESVAVELEPVVAEIVDPTVIETSSVVTSETPIAVESETPTESTD